MAGEEWGLPPAGFDLGNPPRDMGARCNSAAVPLTQNGMRARRAPTLLAAAAVNVSATAAWIRRYAPPGPVQIICSDPGDEDHACAEHLAALVAGRTVDNRLPAVSG